VLTEVKVKERESAQESAQEWARELAAATTTTLALTRLALALSRTVLDIQSLLVPVVQPVLTTARFSTSLTQE
jgi:enoyl-CoA hydratase/carnithine racemase